MSAIWHWILTLFMSLSVVTPVDIQVVVEEPIVVIEQEYGDTPEVAGITTGLPTVLLKREAKRLQSWTPPVTDELTAESIMIMDKSFGTILWSRSPEKVWPLASITKLMSAMVFLEEVDGSEDIFDQPYIMTKNDAVDGTAYIYQGEEVKISDLFGLSLVGSINSATRALLHSIDLSDEEAVEKMNKLARSRGFWNTHFSDVTGLDFNNVTTAKEAAWIIKEALSYEKIQQTLIKDSYTLITDLNRSVTVLNTNKLLRSKLSIEGGKTGYIAESGYNFAVSIQNESGEAVIIVVLGTDNPTLRFSETEFLAEWVFDNYEWK